MESHRFGFRFTWGGPHHINPQQGTAAEKALAVNLDSNFYGSFAEIGAGQEVCPWGKEKNMMIWERICSNPEFVNLKFTTSPLKIGV